MQNKMPVIFVIAVILVGAHLWQRRAGAGALDYVGSWDAAVAEAEATGKPILLNFGGSW